MFSAIATNLVLWSATVLALIFSDQDRQSFNVLFPNGQVAEDCYIIPERQMWDRESHQMLDKYVVGAQVLTDEACAAAHSFLVQLPQQNVTAEDFPPPPED